MVFLSLGIKDAFGQKSRITDRNNQRGRLFTASLPSGLKAAQGTHSAHIHKKISLGSRAGWGYVHRLFYTIMADVCQMGVLIVSGKRYKLLFVHNL
jgi:hypothetical protein